MLPVEVLWQESGELQAHRLAWLTDGEIRSLLRTGPVRFVVANVGAPLRWIPTSDAFDFWKREALSRIASPDHIVLDDFPGGLAYVASRWEAPGDTCPIVLLEAHH